MNDFFHKESLISVATTFYKISNLHSCLLTSRGVMRVRNLVMAGKTKRFHSFRDYLHYSLVAGGSASCSFTFSVGVFVMAESS